MHLICLKFLNGLFRVVLSDHPDRGCKPRTLLAPICSASAQSAQLTASSTLAGMTARFSEEHRMWMLEDM